MNDTFLLLRRRRKRKLSVESNKKFWEYSQAEANFISTVVVSLTDDMIGFQAQHNFSHCTPRTGWHSRSCSFSLPRHPREVNSTNEICILWTTQYWRGGSHYTAKNSKYFSINERHYCQFSVSLLCIFISVSYIPPKIDVRVLLIGMQLRAHCEGI